jgi:hypothetical protein
MSDKNREEQSRDTPGRKWGFCEDDHFVLLPKDPMLRAGYGPPPFTIKLPGGEERNVIVEPELVICYSCEIVRRESYWVGGKEYLKRPDQELKYSGYGYLPELMASIIVAITEKKWDKDEDDGARVNTTKEDVDRLAATDGVVVLSEDEEAAFTILDISTQEAIDKLVADVMNDASEPAQEREADPLLAPIDNADTVAL